MLGAVAKGVRGVMFGPSDSALGMDSDSALNSNLRRFDFSNVNLIDTNLLLTFPDHVNLILV